MTDDVAGIGQELRSLRLAQDMSGGATFVVDAELRIVSAQGPDLYDAGIDPDGLLGLRLDEILREPSPPDLLEAYRTALRGDQAGVEFVDETSGRLFHVEVRPLLGADNDVIGAVARSTDLSTVRAQETHLEHAAALHGLGVSTYDVRSGWQHDERTVAMLGLDGPSVEAGVLVQQVVHPDDRALLTKRWGPLALAGGRLVTSYRVIGAPGPDGGAPVERRIQSTVEAVVGSGPRILRVVATHVDVTAAAAASAELERARQQVQADRLTMVRDLSGVVTASMLSIGEILQTVTDLAVTTLGGGALFAELSDDGSRFERFAVSNDDLSVAGRITAAWSDPATRPVPATTLLGRVVERGLPVTSADDPGWLQEVAQETGRSPVDGISHFIVVPVLHQGRVIGGLSLEHPQGGLPYHPGDVDLAQILADRAGTAVVADRALRAESRERDRRKAETLLLQSARDERRGLVERLSTTEARERRLLAEAVHDEPIQLIAAARLRLMALGRRLDKERSPGEPSRATPFEETARIGKILESAMERLRMLIVALSPHDLDEGLVVALTELADGTFRGTPTVVTCAGPEVVPLTIRQQEAALRIAREALVNARQHASASQVTLEVDVDESSVELRVVDDGIGSVDIGPRKGHLGMVSMRARAEDAGGQLTVASRVAAGTTVVLRFPLLDLA